MESPGRPPPRSDAHLHFQQNAMSFHLRNTVIGTALLTTVIAGTLFAATPSQEPNAQSRAHPRVKKVKDGDDPGARARWMDQWYNENYQLTGTKINRQAAHRGVWSLQYQRYMMDSAQRERVRHAAKMPLASSKAMLSTVPMLARAPGDALSRDLRWTNLGPTRANFLRNGSISLNATDSGRINEIVSHPTNANTLYIAPSGGGLWKTTDGGASWQAKTETLGSLSVGAVAMDPNNPETLYLGLGDPFDGTGLGMVKMTAGGDKWEAPVFLGNSTSIRDILVAPGNSNIVLVATDQGLYRSTDAGKTYAPVAINTGLGETPAIWSIAWGGGNTMVLALEGTPSASTSAPAFRQGQIWRSTDNGATWARGNGVNHNAGVNRMVLASAPSNRSVMYALAAKPRPASPNTTKDFADIFKSTDGGANWISVGRTAVGDPKPYTNPNEDSSNLEGIFNGQGWYDLMAVVDRTNPDVAYFGGALLSAKTSDGGNSYAIITDWLADFGLPYVHADFHSAHMANDGKLYFGTDGGIFMSSNGGSTFTHTLNEGIVSHLVYNVCSTPANTDRVLIGLQDNGTRLRETNTSVFNQVVGGDGFGCNINRSNANRMIGTVQNLRIRRSVDGGNSFSQACTGIPGCGESATHADAPFRVSIVPWEGDATGNTLFTYNNKAVYRTTDYAVNWTALGTTGLPADLFIRGVGVAKTGASTPNSDNVVGIVANGGRVYLTSNGGTSWTQAGALPNNGLSTSSIAFDPVDRNIVYVTSVAPDSSRSHIWRSTNFGQTWAAIDVGNGFPFGIPVNMATVDPVVRTTLYAATHLGVYRSLDSGSTWERLGAFLPLVNVMDVTVSADGNQVRAATYGRGVWELSAVGNNAVPTANFSVASSQLTASFTDTSTDSDGSIVRRLWSFGDGVSASSTNPSHTYAAPGTYTVTLTVTDNGGYSHTKTAQVVVGNRIALHDVNRDGKSDLLWRLGSQQAYWVMNAQSQQSSAYAGDAGAGYRLVASGDFNGDGAADLLFSDNLTLRFWINNGSGAFTTTSVYYGGGASSWQPYGTADINGDGRSDVLWRLGSQVAYWIMNGTTTQSTGYAGDAGTGFRPVGIGDFNGDGTDDLVFSDTNNLKIWINNGSGAFFSYPSYYGGGASGWQPYAAADVNKDGKSDLLWRLGSQVAYWVMNGQNLQSSGYAGDAGSGFNPVGLGDFNGDGAIDLVFSDLNNLKIWMNNGSGAYYIYPSYYGGGAGGWQPYNPGFFIY
jgi:PKD repeat protein